MYPTTLSPSTSEKLRRMIKKKNEHTFGAIESDTLELWKVGESFLSKSTTSDFRGSYLHPFLLRK